MDQNRLQDLIQKAQQIVVLTGAGISTDSGIPDFRSTGGMWDKHQVVTLQEFIASDDARRAYWKYKLEFMSYVQKAKPNNAHYFIWELEKQGKLKGLITQNIDRLHHRVGHSKARILELHGNNWEVVCLGCMQLYGWEMIQKHFTTQEDPPTCQACGEFLKPNTVSFGQALNPDILAQAMQWAKECDLFLALGSSLVVEPAASLPLLAKRHGAKLVIVSLSSTPLDRIADLIIKDNISTTTSS